MPRILALIVCPLLLAAADFKTGLDAYNHGDFATALKEWQPIAEKGDPNAEYNLGLLYARGQGVPQDPGKAVEWYRKAAAQGVPAAQYNLGVMYANGQGVARDQEEARKWFLAAAEQGLGGAQTSLASIYHEGEGSFRNYVEAEKWYRKAAGQGVASAAFNLGVMYDIGQGVNQDYAEALKWYHQAADAGYASAYTNIGVLYYNGQGVKRSVPEAYTWFAKAKRLGDPRAGQLMAWAENKLTPGERRKAETAVAQWQPPAAAPPQVSEAALFKPPAAEAAPSGGADRSAAADKTPSPAVQDVWTGVDRIIAVGDIHGDYEQFTAVLRSAGLIDESGHWTGGRTHLVQTGDVVDRGPDSRPIMDLLMKLETEAKEAGGGVHALIGNHEAMDVYGDLRYVSPAEFAGFAAASGADRAAPGTPAGIVEPSTPRAPAANPSAAHQPGVEELRAAFGPEGRYGRWIRSHNAVIKIDRTLFLHAGLAGRYADWTLERINDEVRAELSDFTRLHGGIDTDEQGPLWNHDLAKGDQKALEPLVDGMLKHFDVDRIVIGHTYADAAITPRFGGKVIMIDVGLPRVYDNIGKLACLEIQSGRVYALHRGHRLDLPASDSGPEMLRYLEKAAALDPKPSPLADRISKLSASAK